MDYLETTAIWIIRIIVGLILSILMKSFFYFPSLLRGKQQSNLSYEEASFLNSELANQQYYVFILLVICFVYSVKSAFIIFCISFVFGGIFAERGRKELTKKLKEIQENKEEIRIRERNALIEEIKGIKK